MQHLNIYVTLSNSVTPMTVDAYYGFEDTLVPIALAAPVSSIPFAVGDTKQDVVNKVIDAVVTDIQLNGGVPQQSTIQRAVLFGL